MTDKPKRISPKVRAAITVMVNDGLTITAAAEKAGLSREHLSRELAKPHVAEHMRTRVVKNLAVSSARAGTTKVALLDSPNEMVRDRASSFILGLAGISPATAPAAPVHGQQPGLQIVIMQGGHEHIVADVSQPVHIERLPAQIEHEPARNEGE